MMFMFVNDDTKIQQKKNEEENKRRRKKSWLEKKISLNIYNLI
jgi:hypothetical protein